MGMLKTLIAGASALALTLAVAGSAGAADKPLYGVLMKTLSNPFWGAMEKGVEEGANKAGVDYSSRRSNPTRRRSRSSTRATPCWRRSRR